MEFKAGDWVRHKRIGSVHKCKSISGGEFDDKISTSPSWSFDAEYMTSYELWHPKQGEYCWFLTCNCGYELGQFVEILSNGQFRYRLNNTNSLFNCSACEPFIGTLPQFNPQ